jgi:hypothetical protein
LINFVSVCILFGLCFVKRKPVIIPLTITSYMLLEAWHGYSHAIHIKNTDLQFIIIHCINYFAVFMTMLCSIANQEKHVDRMVNFNHSIHH